MKMAVKLLFLLLVFISGLSAQTPQSFKYQAIVRDTAGSIIANQLVSFKTSLLTGSENGAVAIFRNSYRFNKPVWSPYN